MPTTNPVPSQDPSDLLFNAGKLDEVLNGTGTSFTDRLGTARRTVAGMNADFDAQLADAESDLNVYRSDAAASAAQALWYLNTIRTTSYGAYASDPATDPLGNPPNVGDEYFNTTSNLLKRFNGTTWQASDINTANLAAPSGSSLVGYDTGTVQDVLDGAKSLQDYAALRAYNGRATRIYITGLLVTAKPAGIVGFFQHDPTDTTSADNGGTIIVLADGRRFKRDYIGDISVEWFEAVGNWNGIDGADDINAIQAAIDLAAITGGIAKCVSGKSYRITSGLTINAANTVLDLNGARLIADFAVGNAVTVGNTAVLDSLGIRNGTVAAVNTSTSLNGVVFKKNVRRNVQYGGLRVAGFKGIGVQFEELNWSIQAKDAPIIESCGINLDIHDNGNALEIAGAGLDGATTYNVRLRGTFGITFVGGYNQFAGTAGVLIDSSTIGAIQPANSTSFYGTYFEGNSVSHIIGNNGRGLVVHGCYMNAAGMTGALIDLNNWTGASIQANNPNNTSGRDFVNADATSSLICVGRQAVSSQSDTLIGGSMNAFVSDAVPVQVNSLPVGSILNLGSQFLLNGSGTGANRSLPYICTTTASGSRAFRRIALQSVKQSAQVGAASFTPNLGNSQCFDLTVPTAGMSIEAPIGAYDDGDEVIFLFRQSSAPSAGVTWNAVYKTDLSSSLLANGYGSVTFRWSAGRGIWIQTGKLEWKA